jgi:hypothetical protein
MVLFSDFMTELGASFGAFFQGIGPGVTLFLMAMVVVVGALIVLAFLGWFFKAIGAKT